MKIGLIGAGALGDYLLKEQDSFTYEITSIYVRDITKYASLEADYNVKLYDDFDAFLHTDIDCVVEVAGVEAAQALGVRTVEKKNILIISIGAFADEGFAQTIEQTAAAHNKQIFLPSGAIGGLDLVQNAKDTNELEAVTIETRKPARSLIDEVITEEKVVFEGPAKDAITLFPKNVNIAIALSLAGLGVNDTIVRLIADPQAKTNQHKITVEGPFGDAVFHLSNEPLPSNPKSSFITAMSIIGTLERMGRTIQISS